MANYKTKILTRTTINGILLSGIMSFLMFPFVFFGYHFPDMGFLAWFHLVPLLLVIHRYNLKTKLLVSFLSGLIASLGQLYWLTAAINQFGGLNYLTSIGFMMLLAVVLAFSFAIFISAASWVNNHNKIPLAILLPVFMLGHDLFLHYLFGGMPWALPAYTQGHWIRFFQWVDHVGAYGLNFYVYFINALIAEGLFFLFYHRQIDKMVSRFLIIFFLVMISFYLSFLSSQKYEKEKINIGNLSLALIQGNVQQDEKWDPYKAQENLHKYLRLTNMAVKNGAEVVIWPETSYPYSLDEDNLHQEKFLEQEQLPAPILFGAVTTSREGAKLKFYNSVIHADKQANLVDVYHKMHLVPYGEYVPLQEYFPFISKFTQGVGNFEFGDNYNLFVINGIKLGSLICFEDVFYKNARDFTNAGADVLVNYTNDAWYGNSSAAYQHLVFSQIRALENRTSVVRSTNTGMTAIIDPTGSLVSQLAPFEEKYLLFNLKIEKGHSFFSRHGVSWVYYVSGLGLLIYLYTLGKWRFGPVKKEF